MRCRYLIPNYRRALVIHSSERQSKSENVSQEYKLSQRYLITKVLLKMAGHNYLSDAKNPFFSLEDDVDDETFVRAAPPGTRPIERYHVADFDQNRLLQRKREIEERTLQSTIRSASLLKDSEQIGAATAEELIKQREQLIRTSKRLDEIDNTLRFSQKHIQGIKSVFGSLKNYLSGKSMDAPIPSTKLSESSSSGSVTSPALSNSFEKIQSNSNNSYPSMQVRGDYDDNSYPSMQVRGDYGDNEFEDVRIPQDKATKAIEQSLNDITGSLANLKHLAIGLSEEIESQNDLIDDINDKTEKADIMLKKQNKDMLHLMKK